MDVIFSIGVFGGGTAIAWFFNAKSKDYKTFASIGFGVLGLIIWILLGLQFYALIPESLEYELVMSMGDLKYSVLLWLIDFGLSCLFLFFIPRRKISS
jgi:hypothetical protein